ncbi:MULTISPECIES: 30S ribosomal protein S20 [Pseudothermotoga]|uniref:Small ribosomal subunit protein bS20 n=1 Tax=Pseudothermotoga lettingae (strain ATCC BAA-301 / DSM 14385 / NBRC 107922 / TMO) TaxID=416591 RepID=A8F5B9_PSELT|nr:MULTISPECIES: 30S ribosomal protein S20 [Pseudothermotoga]ABV33353.1 ribosomal protein S20 [Pseudothermotoga lettingae TMO]KUK21236.1 MAG: 30S ribosomal protein S20 [Pseudothermotoga lettingae]MDI3493999.1 small subunit ribosomal protein [Pseudothermotoga sp.]MDK2884476.1 small subunit ribosomal protein [Pseudothermotoga sp.]GLI49731.1 30S ribosomal protein S20 [Pseudothermotoga lettingae TMO]
MEKKNKSAEKRVRQSFLRREKNRAYKTRMKNAIKKVLAAVQTKESSEKIEELLKQAIAAIDKAASKGVIHKNQAARRKSRLMKVAKA